MTLDLLLNGKIRIKLLTRLLLNPANRVYLRGLEKDFGVSSSTVRVELNKLSELKLIEVVETEGNVKQYKANVQHPMFGSLRGFILKQVGLDSIIEKIFQKLGDVELVYLTNDWAEGKESPFVDLVVVGNIDRNYMNDLIAKVEILISKKIRIAVFNKKDFSTNVLDSLNHVKLF